ncbi:BQ2448_3077 [Microbotryum intermedium]|uniref:BQ2448_3077 protein n=1 Tax=Microbotryum intermedium TaxID=269621 RepID=A0A238FFC5_9BASI|nr:BQ2448_3077 [Microbotryum intermedium]
MPQAGPQLPPHLASASSSSSSSSSTSAAGPRLPPHLTGAPSRPSTHIVGPSLPPSHHPAAAPTLPVPVQDDDDSDDDYGPSLPPDLAAARTATSSNIELGPSAVAASPPKRVLGPTLPSDYPPSASVPGPSISAASPPQPYKTGTPLSNLYSDDDDDAFGPMPLPAGASGDSEENEGVRLVREREERQREREREAERKKNEKPKREDWMMAFAFTSLSAMDPTKLKSRGFQQMAGKGMAHGSAGKPNPEDVNLWTETPQERQKRLEDEMMGRKRKAEISNGGGGAGQPEETDEQRRKRMRDQQLRDEVDRHNKTSRNATLLDQHAKSFKSKEKDDKAPPGIWDHDRDMSVGGRLLDDSKRSDMIKNARDLGGRFGGGRYL